MIFYFTGTGNSYAIAKQIASDLGDEQVTFIPEVLNTNTDLSIYKNEERIGLVFPCYGSNPPEIILEFCEKLSNKVDLNSMYVYAVINYGMAAHASYLKVKSKLLKLNAWFETAMPRNGILLGDVQTEREIQEILAEAKVKLNVFAKDIKEKNEIIMYKNSLNNRFFSRAGRLGNKIILKNTWKKFYADDHCIRCGKCTKMCHAHNITLKERPLWGSNCNACLGCINGCPQRAIQNGKGTVAKGRYVHWELIKEREDK